MPEEPEQVLPQDRAAVGGVEDLRTERRSTSSESNAAASTGNASSTSRDVTKMFQLKIGIRNMVMPGARMVNTVVMKLTPPRIVPSPDSARPMIHRSAPAPGEWMTSLSGA
jgi:hypothetical protein